MNDTEKAIKARTDRWRESRDEALKDLNELKRAARRLLDDMLDDHTAEKIDGYVHLKALQSTLKAVEIRRESYNLASERVAELRAERASERLAELRAERFGITPDGTLIS